MLPPYSANPYVGALVLHFMLFISGAHGRKLSSWVCLHCGRVSTVKVICLHEAHTDSCALPCEAESLMPLLASSLGMHSMISGFPLGAVEPERSNQPACRSWMHQPPGPQESNVCCYSYTICNVSWLYLFWYFYYLNCWKKIQGSIEEANSSLPPY